MIDEDATHGLFAAPRLDGDLLAVPEPPPVPLRWTWRDEALRRITAAWRMLRHGEVGY